MFEKVKLVLGYLLTTSAIFVFYLYAISHENPKTVISCMFYCLLAWLIGCIFLRKSSIYFEDFSYYLWDNDLEDTFVNFVGSIFSIYIILTCIGPGTIGYLLGSGIAVLLLGYNKAVLVIGGILGAIAGIAIYVLCCSSSSSSSSNYQSDCSSNSYSHSGSRSDAYYRARDQLHGVQAEICKLEKKGASRRQLNEKYYEMEEIENEMEHL